MANYNKKTKLIHIENIDNYRLSYLKYKNTPLINVTLKSTKEDHYIGDFLSCHKDKNDIRDDILNMIDNVLDNKSLNEVLSSQYLSVYVEKENSFFIESSDLVIGKKIAMEHSKMLIPTPIFKEITQQWLVFLELEQGR
ncbi:hypothetical protein [Tenacibaculum sp. M341]|uniref:hypothetical protein n=1 Tax=Tenacibaculum sp. M341 TaxID=2530339 RepID=UPI001046C23F|nr:hypothetical protein [Tenacibaculum sp. M341]TCI85011.1 hypothetical protein EYW44_18490 [Tenacibaculum sp. M341]